MTSPEQTPRAPGGASLLARSGAIVGVFFLLTLGSALLFASTPLRQLSHLETPLVRAFRTQPLSGLLFSSAVALKAIGIFLTNFRLLLIGFAGVLAFRWKALGIVGPVLGWGAIVYTYFTLFLNALAAGLVVAGAGAMKHVPWLLVWALGILPHGIFEIGAYALTLSLLLAARRPGPMRIAPVRWAVFASVVLFIAAWIEAGVTPRLLGLVLTR